jgi:hypothetical protein
MEPSLQGRDLVLNCEYPGAWGQLHNAAMASAPGHPFWLLVLREAQRRAPAALPAAALRAAAAARAPAAAASGACSSLLASPAGDGSLRGAAAALAQQLHAALRARAQRLWARTPWHNDINAVLHSTGPMLLTDAYHAYIGDAPACGATAHVGGLANTAYALGSWFTPCLFHDKRCQA